MEHIADSEMVKNAVGEENYDALTEPPRLQATKDHALWPAIRKAIREVYDPEIPVNIFELGLIYKCDIDKDNNVDIKMTLTSPGCPVAGEMPGMVQAVLFPIEGIGGVDVELIWDPIWDPSFMAETAKLELNMF